MNGHSDEAIYWMQRTASEDDERAYQYWMQQARLEYQAWLADPAAQAEYQQWLDEQEAKPDTGAK